MSKANVLFLLNKNKDENLKVSFEIVKYLQAKNVSVYAEEDIAKAIPGVKVFNDEMISFAVVLGGDGTILNFAHEYKKYNLPYFGINLGRVGALAEGTLVNCYAKLDDILNNNYYVEERNVINCKIYSNNKVVSEETAFNEVTITRGNLYKMLLVNMRVNNHNKTSFYADGVIVATSTGSSAYSLSCGGPLLLPDAKNFVIAPIAPQLRTITSLVVNDTDEIEVDLVEDVIRESHDEEKPVVFIDGKTKLDLEMDSKIVITKSDAILKIIKINKEASLFEPIYKVALSTQKLFTTNE